VIRLGALDRLALAGAAVAASAGVWALRTFDPNAANNPFPGCLFHELTGYWCIGCGMTRAMHALVHGQLLAALSMNPLAMLALPTLPLLLAVSRGWVPPRWLQPLARWVSEPKLWLIALPAYWILRNLPWFPFTLLAPPAG
jgi:hypothetical protein